MLPMMEYVDALRLMSGVLACQVWPLATLINYKFVPVHLRPVFMNLVALLWCVRDNT